MTRFSTFFFPCYGAPRDLHSFPTRRSSDLEVLPVSSSGHLVLVPALLDLPYAHLDPELRKSFEVALRAGTAVGLVVAMRQDRKSTRLNSSHSQISYAVFCLKKKKNKCKQPL